MPAAGSPIARGDGCVGFLAQADWEMTVPGHMGSCNLWNVIDKGRPAPFPRCPWALDLGDKPFPGRDKRHPDPLQLGGWYWESGFDHDPLEKVEYIRDWNFRAMYGAWDAMKNVDRVLPNYKLNWAAYVEGKRESRRLLGDLVLTKADLVEARHYPDGCVPTGWEIDIHRPDKRFDRGFEHDAFISHADFGSYPQPFWIPYRCLYSRNVANLFMAGRCISVTHEALGAVRVMRTGGCMGEMRGPRGLRLQTPWRRPPRGVHPASRRVHRAVPGEMTRKRLAASERGVTAAGPLGSIGAHPPHRRPAGPGPGRPARSAR